MWRRCAFVLLNLLLGGSLLADDVVTVAVASNFATTARELSALFTAETGVAVRMSSGSTGKLYAQILHGAPFDVFLAADSARPEALEAAGLIVVGSRQTYATGHLVLWSREDALDGKDCRDVLQEGAYQRLAMANPDTAPYGAAAREFLKSAGLWELASRRAVFGESISQTLHFVATGNATLGFIALSQLKHPGLPGAACEWFVPHSSHAPLRQQAVLLTRASGNAGARRFSTFLQTQPARDVIERHGYSVADRWTR